MHCVKKKHVYSENECNVLSSVLGSMKRYIFIFVVGFFLGGGGVRTILGYWSTGLQSFAPDR